jgi:hypothetical protein
MLNLFEGHPSQYYFDPSELNFKVLMEPNWPKKPLFKKLNEFIKNKPSLDWIAFILLVQKLQNNECAYHLVKGF